MLHFILESSDLTLPIYLFSTLAQSAHLSLTHEHIIEGTFWVTVLMPLSYSMYSLPKAETITSNPEAYCTTQGEWSDK